MNKNERDRVIKNRKCISIISKPLEEISSEEKKFIKDNYSGYGSILDVEGLAQFFTPQEVSFELDNYLNKVYTSQTQEFIYFIFRATPG